jgi:hypothetical protein
MEILTDQRIGELISEPKIIPIGLLGTSKPMSMRNSHYQKGFEFDSELGNKFAVKVRQASLNPMNFSVILGYVIPGTYSVFRLRRYNGKSHFHSNPLENQPAFYDYHVHTATERYQRAHLDPDHFAVITNNFWDLPTAINALINECGFGQPFAGTLLFP